MRTARSPGQVRTELDVIAAIEAAYDATEDSDRWLARIVDTIHPSFAAGSPTSAFSYRFRPDGMITLGAFASAGDPPFTREQFAKQQAVPTPDLLRRAFECGDMLTLLSRGVGMKNTQEGLRPFGMEQWDDLVARAAKESAVELAARHGRAALGGRPRGRHWRSRRWRDNVIQRLVAQGKLVCPTASKKR